MKKTSFFIHISILVLLGGCAGLPYREVTYRQIKKAEETILQAQRLEAPVYAPETYLEARLVLRKARARMSVEKYDESRALAQEAERIGQRACEESREERMRIKSLAERLLFRGEEIWDSYQKDIEKKYAPEALIEIKKLLEEGRGYLDMERYMDGLETAQKSHQKLAMLPEQFEKGKVFLLEEELKRISSLKTAEEIIEEARKTAAAIIEEARRQADKEVLNARIAGAKARLEEFERMYPSTYKVKKGETLNDIAKRRDIFNDQFMWPLIYKANRDQIRDPKVVFPGQVLSIPRDITFQDIIEARKQAEASPPYIPPREAYNPEFYRRYILVVPEEDSPETEKPGSDEASSPAD